MSFNSFDDHQEISSNNQEVPSYSIYRDSCSQIPAAPNTKNVTKPYKKIKANNSSATSPAGSTSTDAQDSTESNQSIATPPRNAIFDEEDDMFNVFYYEYEEVPQDTVQPKRCRGNGCSKAEKAWKKVFIQNITRNIVSRLTKDSDFKARVLNTVCQWLHISEEQLFDHLKETFNGLKKKKTAANVASHSELFAVIGNSQLCVIWNPETDIMTKVAWHTFKIFFVDDDGVYYNNWVKDLKKSNEEEELLLNLREEFWSRFKNPDSFVKSQKAAV